MKDCRKIKQILSFYLDGILSSSEEEAVKKHLDSCASCQEDYNALQQLSKWLEQMGRDIYAAPPGLKNAVMAELREQQTLLPAPLNERKVKPQSRWKQLSVGIAAAALLTFTASATQLGNLVKVAQNPPSQQVQVTINNSSENTPSVLKTEENKNNDTNAPSGEVKETPNTITQENNNSEVNTPVKPDNNDSNVSFHTQENPVENNLNALSAVLLNKKQEVENTLLKMQVDDVDKALTQINAMTQQQEGTIDNLGEQTSNDKVYRIYKITVDKSKSIKLITALQQLGTTISKQADGKDISILYTETLEQYLTLDKQRKTLAADSKECQQVEQKMKALEEELKALQDKAAQATIVLWLQDQ